LNSPACLTKRPSSSGKTKKPDPSTKGASGEPPKAEAKGSAPSPPGFVALTARGEARSSGSAILGAEAKTAAEGFAPPLAGLTGVEAKAEAGDFAAPPADTELHQFELMPVVTLGATVGQMSLKPNDDLRPNSIQTGPAPTSGTASTPVTSDQKAESVAIVEGRLSREPAAIRDLARNLSQEFASQAEDLKRSRPNDERLAQHDDLIAFFERIACGLAELADALDEAVSKGTAGSLDSGSLGKAAQIARGLHQGVMQWIEQNVTSSIDRVFNVGLFCAGIAFLHWIGADSTKVVAGLTTLLAIKGGQAKDAPKSKKKPRKSEPSD
jgi:hypothetical protein